MKIRIFILAALLGAALRGQTRLPITYSGPFWHHVVQDFTTTSNSGCTLTVNGGSVPIPNGLTLDNVNAPITFSATCTEANGMSSQTFTGTLTPTMPPETPLATLPGFNWTIPAPGMPTSMAISATMTPGATRTPGSTFDFTATVQYGNSGSTVGGRTCFPAPVTKKAQPKGGVQISLTATCDNTTITETSASQPHGFGDGSSVAEIVTTVELRGLENWVGSNQSITPAGYVSFWVRSQYKMAQPKAMVSVDKLQIQAVAGQTNGGSGNFDVKNVGGGKLDVTVIDAFLTSTDSGVGSANVTFSPKPATNILSGQSATLTGTVDTTNVRKDGTLTGNARVLSDTATNTSNLSFPVSVTTGGGACPATTSSAGARPRDNPPCTDTISLSSGSPANGTSFEQESVQRFSGHVKYTVGAKEASIALELTDQDGNPVGGTDPVTSQPGTAEGDFIIGSIIVPKSAKQLSMRAVMRRGGTVAASAGGYNYTVVGPALVSLLRLGNLNEAGSKVLEGPLTLTPATVGYYSGPHNPASVLIRCTGSDGGVLGQSSSQPAVRSDSGNLTSAEVTMPQFTIPAGAQQMICYGVLQDKTTGEEIKSPPWTIGVEPPGSIKLLLGTTAEMPVANPFLIGGSGFPVYLEASNGSRQAMQARFHYTAPSRRYARVYYSSRKADGTVVNALGDITGVELQQGTEADVDSTLSNFIVDNLADYWDFWATMRSPDANAENVKSPLVTVPVHRVRVVPSPVPFPKDPLVAPSTPKFTATVEYNQARPELHDLIGELQFNYSSGDTYSRKTVFAPLLGTGEHGQVQIAITPERPITSDVYSVSLRIYLQRTDSIITAITSITYGNIAKPTQLPKGQSSVPGPLDFKTFVNNLGRDFLITTANQADIQAAGNAFLDKLMNKLGKSKAVPPGLSGKAQIAPADAAIAPPAILATAQSWQISQPIAADGSFLADVTFHYDPQFFPDDPNFQESAMQVISFDPATGLFTTYPTTIDTKARTATARLSSLAPNYGLGVVGPFSKYSAEQPIAGSSFTVVNTGKTTANLTPIPFDFTGLAADPLAAAIAPGQQFSAAGATVRFELRADQNSLAGVDVYSDLQSFDTLPITAPAAVSVLPGIEVGTGTNTRIDLVNPHNMTAAATLTLVDNTGTLVDSADVQLAAKGFSSTGVGQLFPNMPTPFQGYVILTSTLPLTAAKRTQTVAGGSALNALPVTAVQGPAGVLRSAHLIFDGARDTSLRLVNLSDDARITIGAFAEDGTPVGTPLTTTVASGAEFWQDLGAALQLSPAQSWSGTIQIQGAPPGMLGAVSFSDPAVLGVAELPLGSTGDKSVIVPYLVNDGATGTTSVYVANAGAATANAQLKSYNPDGSLAGAANLTVRANGRASGALSTLIAGASGQAGGYLTVDSDQPVLAFAVVSGTKDFASVIGQPAPGSAAVSVPAPAIGVSPSSGIAFNNAPAGADTTQTLTISNTGTLPLAISKLAVTGPQFSITGPALPFTVAAGGQQAVTVHFRSATAGPFSDTLLIGSNDPVQPVVPVPLSATAVGTTAADKLSVSSTSVDFGTVTVGSTRDMTVAATNQGTASFTLSAAVAGSSAFTVTAPALPATVQPNQTVQINIHFAPVASNTVAGTVSLTTGGGARADIAVQGTGAAAPTAVVLVSDDFKRANVSDPCALGPADLALGGSGTHYYLPLFPVPQTIAVRPQGASLVSNALQNSGADFGGVMFTASATPCDPAAKGEAIAQDLNLRASLLVPGDTAGHTTAAGPLFRTRAASAGDGILGGSSAGYWVQLYSTGEVKVKQLNPQAFVATTGVPASFDNTAVHTLEAAAQGSSLQVSLDGKLLTFLQGSASTTTVAIPATIGSNDGAAGIAFGAEDNRGALGGQRATNVVVSRFSSLAGLPVQPLGSTGSPQTPLKVDGGTFNNAIGFTFGAGAALFVNRLTPLKYPATIVGMQIYFGNRADGLALNAPISTFVGVNPGGKADLSMVAAGQIVPGSGTVGVLGAFNTYPVQPVTIQSGDFVVGFTVNDPAGLRPADLDQASPSQGRSYVSSNGTTFSLIDLGGPSVAGNFGIRALVTGQ